MISSTVNHRFTGLLPSRRISQETPTTQMTLALGVGIMTDYVLGVAALSVACGSKIRDDSDRTLPGFSAFPMSGKAELKPSA
jgi:hypothetical protein